MTPKKKTAPVPTLTEDATVPPTGIPVPASDFGVSDIDLRGAIQMLTQIVAFQAQISNVIPTSSSQPGDSSSSRVNRGGSSGPSQSFYQSSASAPPSGPSHQQQWSHFRPSQGNRGSHQQGHHGGRFQQQRRPPFPRCGKMHLGICYMDLPIYYGYGFRGHIQRDCRSSRQGAGRGMAQPASSAATTSIAPPLARGTPTPAWHGAARGGSHSLGGSNRFYAMRGRQNSEASPDVVTGILTVQSHDMYALIDPGSTLSYVTLMLLWNLG
ncbi:uncharacterized protein [Nicotiana tomentosiformis]|uniref:uncharacterized protein n=1 Tax=Nicotiana tomentosiformis TaxID=4098 RepID=UPI00388C841E